MKRILTISVSLATLVLCSAAALAQDPACGCCAAPSCSCDLLLHADVCQQASTVQISVKPLPTAKVVETVKTIPVCHKTQVCVVDPCTGCKHTECRTETVLEKVKCISIDILPPGECTTECKVKVHSATTVSISHAAPCCEAPSCCH